MFQKKLTSWDFQTAYAEVLNCAVMEYKDSLYLKEAHSHTNKFMASLCTYELSIKSGGFI